MHEEKLDIKKLQVMRPYLNLSGPILHFLHKILFLWLYKKSFHKVVGKIEHSTPTSGSSSLTFQL